MIFNRKKTFFAHYVLLLGARGAKRSAPPRSAPRARSEAERAGRAEFSGAVAERGVAERA